MDQDIDAPQGSLPQSSTPSPQEPELLAPDSDAGFGMREVLLVGLALLGGGLITFALLMGRGVPATHAAAAATPPASDSVPREAKPAASTGHWSAARRSLWLGERRKGVAFDVNAEETAAAWMKTVRPILVVRCTGGTIEAFVVTDTAAQIEPRTDAHTVRIGFDDQPPVMERWPDSAEHDALFAPDAAAFATRLASARMLHFGFTPHNAPSVTARFNVSGLAPLLAPAIKDCGWEGHRRGTEETQ